MRRLLILLVFASACSSSGDTPTAAPTTTATSTTTTSAAPTTSTTSTTTTTAEPRMTVAEALVLAGGDPANVPLIISDVLDAELCAVHVDLLYEELPVLSEDERGCMLDARARSRAVVHGFLSIDSPPFPEITWVQPDGSVSWHLDWSDDPMGGSQWQEVRCGDLDVPDPDFHREFTWSGCDEPTILFRRGYTDEPILMLVTPSQRSRIALPVGETRLGEGETRHLWMVERDTPRPRWSIVGSATRFGDLIHAEWTGPERQWRAVDGTPDEAVFYEATQGMYDLVLAADAHHAGDALGAVEFNWASWLGEPDPAPILAETDPERAILRADGVAAIRIGRPMESAIADLEDLLGPRIDERTFEECTEWLTRSIHWPGDIITDFSSADPASLDDAVFAGYSVGGTSEFTTADGVAIGTPALAAASVGVVVMDGHLPYGATSIELDGGLVVSLDSDVSDPASAVSAIGTRDTLLADC